MNNKSMYAILCILSMFAMLSFLPERYHRILDVLICGGALYDAVKGYRTSRKVSVRMLGMVVVAVLANPIYPVSSSLAVRTPTYLLAVVLFYYAAKRESLLPDGETPTHDLWEGKDFYRDR